MGIEKQKWFTRLAADESDFVAAIGDPLLDDKSTKLRVLVRACKAWVTAGIVRLDLAEIQRMLCQLSQQEQRTSEAGYSDAAVGAAPESPSLPPKKPLAVIRRPRLAHVAKAVSVEWGHPAFAYGTSYGGF